MRDHLILWVNGLRHEVRGGDAFLMLGDWLRGRLGLTGTKILCAEGDCGVCTVLVAEPAPMGAPCYLPVNSCLRFLFQLDGCHVVTVDGLSRDGALAPVQQAMVDCHGSQCGFCTPGMVMTLTGGCHAAAPGTDVDWRKELSGNLCRCTGYVSIFEAAAQARREPDWLAGRFPDADWLPEAARRRRESLDLTGESAGTALRVTSPATLPEALAARRHPGARVVAGGTDLGVLWNHGKLRPPHWLDLSRLPDLREAAFETTGDRTMLVAGALASWTRLLDACRERLPQAVPILEAFGGPQIRHVGTLGGNLVTGSPIADSLPLLFALEATLDLASAAGTRSVPIESFYRGYRQVDLGADELLLRVRVPLPRPDDRLRLVKVARRRDLDISTFTSALLLRRAGDRIESARLACGGVGPTVVRLRRTEAFLAGQPFTEDSFRQAGEMAADEIRPITDVRGSAEYRRQLARGALLKFFHEEVASA